MEVYTRNQNVLPPKCPVGVSDSKMPACCSEGAQDQRQLLPEISLTERIKERWPIGWTPLQGFKNTNVFLMQEYQCIDVSAKIFFIAEKKANKLSG